MPDKLTDGELATIAKALKALSLLPETKDDPASGAIQDFTLQITKDTRKLIAWGTGAGAGVPVVAAAWGFISSQGPFVVSSLVLAAAIVLAAGAYALARVADGDIRGRASAATAAIQARGVVATRLIEIYTSPASSDGAPSTGRASSPGTPTETQVLQALAVSGNLTVSTTSGSSGIVSGVRWVDTDRHVELQITDKESRRALDWVPVSAIKSFS